jgi:hypothetical protein
LSEVIDTGLFCSADLTPLTLLTLFLDAPIARYSMSVKDQLEQSHIDGSHTTVKSKRSTTSTVMSAFNKEAAWKKEQYGNYEGMYCILTVPLPLFPKATAPLSSQAATRA